MFVISYELTEAMMLICFGSSWPFAIMKSFRSKSTGGVSISFLALILAGYVFGIAYKLLQQPDGVIWLYVINSTMIVTEMILYFRYKKASDGSADSQIVECFCPSVCSP